MWLKKKWKLTAQSRASSGEATGCRALVAAEWSQDTRDEELMALADGARVSEEPIRDVKGIWNKAVQQLSETATGTGARWHTVAPDSQIFTSLPMGPESPLWKKIFSSCCGNLQLDDWGSCVSTTQKANRAQVA